MKTAQTKLSFGGKVALTAGRWRKELRRSFRHISPKTFRGGCVAALPSPARCGDAIISASQTPGDGPCAACVFERVDRGSLFQRSRPMSSEAVRVRQCLRKGVDIEADLARRRARLMVLAFQVDRHRSHSRRACASFHQLWSTSSCGRTIRRKPFLEAVVEEDVGEAGRGSRQRMPEISSSAQGRVPREEPQPRNCRPRTRILWRIAIGGLVQHEIGDLVAVLHHSASRRTGSCPSPERLIVFQELLGDDHVGVDVDQRHGRRDPGQHGELCPWAISSGRTRVLLNVPVPARQGWRKGYRGTAKVMVAQSVAAIPGRSRPKVPPPRASRASII